MNVENHSLWLCLEGEQENKLGEQGEIGRIGKR